MSAAAERFDGGHLRANDSALYLAALLEDAGLSRADAICVAETAHAAGADDHDGGFMSQRGSLERSERAHQQKAEKANNCAAAIRRVIAAHYAPRSDADEIPW